MPQFRTKARAIELLGKGQIADLPTAISELWKNGYDAYADNLLCYLFAKGSMEEDKDLFIITDDGHGMTENDIKEKWLILGTDSKARDKGILIEDRLGKRYRVPAGEKGIGRLSVAYIGSPMLMFSKKKNQSPAMLFFDWTVLDNLNLFIDDITVPVRTVKTFNGKFTLKDINDTLKQLIVTFRKNITNNVWDGYEDIRSDIIKNISKVNLDDKLYDIIFKEFDNPIHSGTIFIVFNPHPHLCELPDELLVKGSGENLDSPITDDLRKSLTGFFQPFPNDNNCDTTINHVNTHFYINRNKSVYQGFDLVEKDNFFTYEDIFKADHYVGGSFDESGKFRGKVRVYDKEVTHYHKSKKHRNKTPYGPFSFQFGFLEGTQKSSKLTEEEWFNYNSRLKKFGGLYLYRDKLRVLPYGRTEYDFLEFEKRRNLGAGYYFFSHRRMFGFIEITRKDNDKLIDKAGREGLIRNSAYTSFYDDLVDLLTEISSTYFYIQSNKPKPSLRQELISRVQEENENVIAEKKRTKNEIKQFKKDLDKNKRLLKELINSIEEKVSLLREIDMLEEQEAIIKIIEDIDKEIIKLVRLNRFSFPKRIQPANNLINRFSDFKEDLSEALLKIESYNHILQNVRKKISNDRIQEEIDRKKRKYIQKITNIGNHLVNRMKNVYSRWANDIRKENVKIRDEFERKIETEYFLLQKKQNPEYCFAFMKEELNRLVEEFELKFNKVIDHFERVDETVDEDLLIGKYRKENKELHNKLDIFYELSQLGMAIEIIDHQFNVLYSEITNSIKHFSTMSMENEKDKKYYDQLRQAFEHLETSHQLLAPLYRTTRRSRILITGKEIADYINEFYNDNFSRNKVDFSYSKAFEEFEFYTFESVIKPVFINIINNAIYWLRSQLNRKIKFDYRDGNILILNNGEKIPPAELEDIFHLFYTKKPMGRGIGLYLARMNLRTIGYDINATNDRSLNIFNGACFVIRKI